MAMIVNILLMMGALALVGYPLMQPESNNTPTTNGVTPHVSSHDNALAETELDQALGKAENQEYQELVKRLGPGK